MVLETIILQTLPTDPNGVVPIIPVKQNFTNATDYSYSFLKNHFESVKLNEDFTYISISSDDLKKFLASENSYVATIFNQCPEHIEQSDVCRMLFLEESKLRVIHSGSAARRFHKSLNTFWGGTLLWNGYENVVFAKTLPGNAMGLMSNRPLAILTIGTLLGISLSFCENVTPWATGKRFLSTASFVCLIPAKLGEAALNKAGGGLVAIPVVSGVMSKLGIADVKLNFTSEIRRGPGASVTDFKDGMNTLNQVLRFLSSN